VPEFSTTESNPMPRAPLAIVGVDALFPGSTDARGFWSDILAGNDQLREVPPTHWLLDDYYDPDPAAPDKTYANRGAFLDEVDFDPLEWGIPPGILPATDSSQLLALIVAQRVLDDATGGRFQHLDRSRVSVILGVTGGQELLGSMVARLQRPVWEKALREAGIAESLIDAAVERILAHYVPWQESTFPGLLGNVVAGRIANRLDLGGTNCITDAACASSISALAMAANELHLGDSDLVITGGVDTMNDAFMYMCFSKTPALSPTGDCRPFSDRADGTMLGEGLGMVALKRLADAERDGDQIYAVVRGIGASSDGRATSVYAPLAVGQARALRRAYERAGYSPDTVELVEAHGTGTKAGDAAEVEGLNSVFGPAGGQRSQWCALGSVKSLVGHTKAAAGSAGLFKAVMAIRHRALPPMVKIDAPNPRLELDRSPFYINTRARPWVRGSTHERRASVSSFGFGGSNFHVTVSDYAGPGARAPRLRTADAELVVFGGEPEAVAHSVREASAQSADEGYLRWLSRTSLSEYDAERPARLAIVARDEQDLMAKLDAAAERIAADGAAGFILPEVAYGVNGGLGGSDATAFLFPGQGSQYLHMGADLAIAFESALTAWDLAADLPLEDPLASVVFPVAAFDDERAALQRERLTATEWAQPGIGAASLAMLRLLEELELEPSFLGGHSFGELSALHAAGALGAADLLALARRRGERMRDAAQASGVPGGMLAVAASVEAIEERLARWGSPLVLANHNGPEQVVLSGPADEIDAAKERLAEARISATRLPVATAFHSPLVAGASESFQHDLDGCDLASPAVPVYTNATGDRYPDDLSQLRSLLGSQLASPVRFAEMVERMYADGARTFVEVGPSSVLTGLVGKILEGRPHAAVGLDRSGGSGVVPFLGGLARLVAAGVSMNLGALWSGYREEGHPAERTKPKLALSISGVNYGRPYPADPAGASDPPPLASPPPAPPPPAPPPPATSPRVPALQATSPPAPPPPAPSPATSSEPEVTISRALAPADTDALLAVEHQVAEVHRAAIRSMSELHAAYLQGYQQTVRALIGQPIAPLHSPAVTVPAGPDLNGAPPTIAAPPAMPVPPTIAAPLAMPVPSAIAAPPPIPVPSAIPVPPAAPVSPVPPANGASASAPPAAPSAAPPTVDMMSLVLQVVGEKTGYPTEMLTMDMQLESDLGIDSIKRVEILATVRDRVPDLPEVEPGELAGLATIAEIADYLSADGGAHSGDAGAPSGAAPGTGENAGASTAMAANGDALRSIPSTGAAAVELRRYVLRTREAPAPGLALPGLRAGSIVIVDGGLELGQALVAELRTQGVEAAVVSAVPPDAAGLILLGSGLDGDGAHASDDAVAAFQAAKSMAGRFSASGGVFVTVQDTGGSFAVDTDPGSRAWGAGLAGLARCVAKEWPEVTVKAIDVDRAVREAGAVAGQICQELLQGGTAAEVGLGADGTRVVLEDEPSDAQPGPSPLGLDDVVVVTGGARGVTAACVIALARTTRARFVLCGRTRLEPEPPECAGVVGDGELKRALFAAAGREGAAPTPADLGRMAAAIRARREIQATIAAVEAFGTTARYVELDVTDADAVARALADVRATWGPITGLIHGAGVLADKRIADKSEAEFRRVFATKVDGMRALLAATASEPLKVVCAFSSVAARAGNAGQADYAMANEVLNKVAGAESRRRGPGCIVKSIGWGPWAGGMVTPELERHFAGMGVGLIPLEDGALALVEELAVPSQRGVEPTVGAFAGSGQFLGEPDSRPAEIWVGSSTHPHFRDHAIQGTVVVPVAYAVEWMIRAARCFWPGARLTSLDDVAVVRGIRLPDFDTGRVFRLAVRATSARPEAAEIELIAADGTVHYRCRPGFGELPQPGPLAIAVEPFGTAIPYGGRSLFHGPAFEILAEVTGMGTAGAHATLNTASAMGWAPDHLVSDPAVLDGVLQLALLWVEQNLGAAALPTGVRSLRVHDSSPVDGTVHGIVRANDADPGRVRGDAIVRDGAGSVRLELIGLEAHTLPDSR
jgi:acyl transferase domain-containing protein